MADRFSPPRGGGCRCIDVSDEELLASVYDEEYSHFLISSWPIALSLVYWGSAGPATVATTTTRDGRLGTGTPRMSEDRAIIDALLSRKD